MNLPKEGLLSQSVQNLPSSVSRFRQKQVPPLKVFVEAFTASVLIGLIKHKSTEFERAVHTLANSAWTKGAS